MPRPRKGARIFRRPDRPGWYAYVSRDEPHIALGTEDETEAQANLLELLNARRLRAVAPGDRPIAAVFAEQLTRARTNNSGKTSKEHGLDGSRLLHWMVAHDINSTRQITKQVVEDYKTSRRFTVGARRINNELSTLSRVLQIAEEWKLIPTSLGIIERMTEPRPQPNQLGLSLADLNAFWKAETDPAYWALFRSVGGSGIRDDEARHWSKTDLQPPWLVVTPKPPGFCKCHPKGWTTKNYRYRQIPASKETIAAAAQLIGLRDQISWDNPKGVWNRIQRVRLAAGIEKHFSMHDLRRAWASHMLAEGNRLEDISRWLGHADLMTTQRYLRMVTSPLPKSLPF